MSTYSLYLHFKRHDPSKYGFFENLIFRLQILISEGAIFSDPNIHVEISLQKDDEFPETYFCNIGGVDKQDYKMFTSDHYESPFRYKIDSMTYNKTREFLERQLGKEFNTWGYRINFIPIIKYIPWFNVDTNQKSYFCGEFVAHALLVSGHLKNVKPYLMTAQDIYTIISKDGVAKAISFESHNFLDQLEKNYEKKEEFLKKYDNKNF